MPFITPSTQIAPPKDVGARPFSLRELLSHDVYARMAAGLAQNSYRRLSQLPETEVDVKRLCQSVHVNRRTGAAERILGGHKSGCYMHSLQSLPRELDELREAGLAAVYLKPLPEHSSMECAQIVDWFAEMARAVRELDEGLYIAVDPQGLCMGKDLRWGIRDHDSRIDSELTLRWLAQCAFQLAQAGVDALVTIGRINFEATAARSGLDKADKNVELWAFSTNSETTNAYFELTAHDIKKANTGQKLLVGNNTEMLVRALLDVSEGVDVVIQKPVENLQVLHELRNLLNDGQRLRQLRSSPIYERLMKGNPWLLDDSVFESENFLSRVAAIKLGTYEVSGTYAIYKHIEDAYSDQLAYAMLDELYRNSQYAVGSKGSYMIGRNMLWYAQQRRGRTAA